MDTESAEKDKIEDSNCTADPVPVGTDNLNPVGPIPTHPLVDLHADLWRGAIPTVIHLVEADLASSSTPQDVYVSV